MSDEDLGLKPGSVEQAKFEYSPLGKIYNKGLKEEDKKEGFLKRLKNIETNQNSNNNDSQFFIPPHQVVLEVNQAVMTNLKGVFVFLI